MSSLIGLVVVLALIGVLVKKQLAPRPASAPANGTVLRQSLQSQEQVRKAVEGAMQQPRPMPEDSP